MSTKGSVFEKPGKGLNIKKALIELYEGEDISRTNDEASSEYSTQPLDIFLHTHACPFPIPIKKFTTSLTWSETALLSQAQGSLSLRMPFQLFHLFFQGEGTEPSTGHWISIRRRTENPFRAAGTEFKKRPKPEVKFSGIPTVNQITEQAKIQAEFEKREESRLKSFNRKMERITYELLWLGQIETISFNVFGDPGSGTSVYSDINIGLMNWEYPLKTSNYKIVNASIDRAKQANPDDVETIEAPGNDFSGISESGGRFIIDNDIFKELVKAITTSVSTAEDPKIGIKQILDVFGYQRLPGSIYKTNLTVRKMIKEVEEYKPKPIKIEKSAVGTPEELDASLDTVQKKMAHFGLTELVDQSGRTWTQQEAANLTLISFQETFVDTPVVVTVTGTTTPAMGGEIKVCTVLEDLPPSAGYLRQILPTKLQYFKNITRFKELLTQNGTPWTRILGSFVPDPNIIEFFPIIINYTRDDLKAGWKPQGQSLAAAGFQLCLIWRLKPLRPNEFLDRGFYNDLVKLYNQKGNMWREIEETDLQLKSEKIGDDDNNMTHSSLLLNTLHVEDISINYKESGRCNGAYLEHAFLRSESNLKFGTLSQPLIDTSNAQKYGFKMFEANYPFMDATVTKDVRDALTERIYCTQRDEGEGAYGRMTMRGLFHHPMRPGMFCSLVFDSKTNAMQGLQGVSSYTENAVMTTLGNAYVDQVFTFHVHSITYQYSSQPDGFILQQTIVDYSRGKFSGLPTLLPTEHKFGRPKRVATEAQIAGANPASGRVLGS
jgi:hypothetical protein